MDDSHVAGVQFFHRPHFYLLHLYRWVSHVVVGSCEAAYDVLVGNSSVADYFFKFLIPTGLGNILGGTGVFTLLVSAQVKAEKNS